MGEPVWQAGGSRACRQAGSPWAASWRCLRTGTNPGPEPRLRLRPPPGLPCCLPSSPATPSPRAPPWGPPFMFEVSFCRFSRLSPGVPEPGPRLCSLSSVSGCFSPHLSPSRALPPPSPSPCPQLSPAPSPSPVFLSPQSSLRCVLSRRLCRSLPLRIFLRPCPARPRAPPALPQCRAAGRGALRPRVNRWTLLER